MSNKIICGIDIGSSKIATVVAMESEDSEELRVIGFNTAPSRGVRKGLIVDIEEVTKAIEKSVEKAERMSGHRINSAFVSVGGPHISSTNSDGVVAVSDPSEINQEDIERAIETARAINISTQKKVIEVIPRDFGVDGQQGIKNPVGMSGTRLEVDVHMITASTTNLKNIERCLTDLGINNDGYVFAGLASAEAVLTNTEKELGVALVDIGGGKTDLCVYVDGSLKHSVSIPLGARHITNDIAIGLRTSLESAEKIKLHLTKYNKDLQEISRHKHIDKPLLSSEIGIDEDLGDVSLKEVIDGIIIPRLEEIYDYISKELDPFYRQKQIPSGIVLTGGGAHTIVAEPVGRKIISLPIRLGVPTSVTGLIDEVIDPQYATTLGLIIYGRQNQEAGSGKMKDLSKMLGNVTGGNVIGKISNFFKKLFLPN